MMRSCAILFLLLWAYLPLFGQKRVISGTVRDIVTGELLIGSTVSDSLSGSGVQTNAYGFFSLRLETDVVQVKISYVGYQSRYIVVGAATGVPMDIRLEPAIALKEITIAESRLLSRPAGNLSLSVQQIRALPALLGEADVLKALSFTPGVSTGTEGSAGLYVRGGTPDQNLILLDEAPIYNVNHLGGFFSVFNPNSLKSVELYKGAFPARFGGRLASVIDLTMKDGNNRKFGGEIGLGLLNQNLTLEGPVIKNKASFIISGRVSTLGLTNFLKTSRKRNSYGSDYLYRFHDLNVKLNYQLNKTDQLYISFYNGFDRFTYNDWVKNSAGGSETSMGNNWGNNTGTIRYSKALSPKLFARAALIYSHYTSEYINELGRMTPSDTTESRLYRKIEAGVQDFGVKLQVDYFQSSRLTIRVGLDTKRHNFTPFSVSTNYPQADNSVTGTHVKALQNSLFIDSDFSVTKQLKVNIGIRGNLYKVEDRNFTNVEPRIGANWALGQNWVLKGGFSVMNQYIHLLTSNGYAFGYDAWLPATVTVPPSHALQWSAGMYRSFRNSGIDISVEMYTKTMNRLIDYPDGANFTGALAKPWDEIVTTGGRGRAKGLEVMLSKRTRHLTGWVAYTLSKSERQFESINNGAWYPIKYDRRHNLSVTAGYQFKQKWRLNSTFVYQTGHAVTLPDAAILPDGVGDPGFIYSDRNNGRMPAYHRMDMGATRFLTTRHGRKAELSFGLYNAYNRNNPLYLDFKTQRNAITNAPESIQVKQYSMFPVLPYINYVIKF